MTFSAPSAADGAYTSFYNPVGTEPVMVRVAVGDRTWEVRGNLHLRHFGSTRLDLRLPAVGSSLARPTPVPTPGAIYEATLVGTEIGGRAVRPLAAHWPDANGRFELLLPRSVQLRRITFFEAQGYYLAPLGTRPGSAVPLRVWPTRLGSGVSQALHVNPLARSAP